MTIRVYDDKPSLTRAAADYVLECYGIVVANHVPKLDSWRITLTALLINNAASITFLVAGSAKAAPLKAVLEGPPQPDDFSSQLIRPVDGELVLLVDAEAAAQPMEQV
jgi:6-phosphogluconolactonase